MLKLKAKLKKERSYLTNLCSDTMCCCCLLWAGFKRNNNNNNNSNSIEGPRSCTTHKDYFSRFNPEHEMLSSEVEIWLAVTHKHSLSLTLSHSHAHTHIFSHSLSHIRTLSLNVVRLHTDLEFEIMLQKSLKFNNSKWTDIRISNWRKCAWTTTFTITSCSFPWYLTYNDVTISDRN